jgi:hypothetical protein
MNRWIEQHYYLLLCIALAGVIGYLAYGLMWLAKLSAKVDAICNRLGIQTESKDGKRLTSTTQETDTNRP